MKNDKNRAKTSEKAITQKREKPRKRSVFKAFWWRRGRDSNPCGVAPRRFSRPPRYDRFDTSPYMKLSFDRNHQIFNCFRNSFGNALLCCCRSAEKVRCRKAFQGFCVCIARKFSSLCVNCLLAFLQSRTVPKKSRLHKGFSD